MIQHFTQECRLFCFVYRSEVHLYVQRKIKNEKGKGNDRRLRKRKEDRKKKNQFSPFMFLCHISLYLLDLDVYTQSPVLWLCFHLVLTLLNILIAFSRHIATLNWLKITPHPKYIFYFQHQDLFFFFPN